MAAWPSPVGWDAQIATAQRATLGRTGGSATRMPPALCLQVAGPVLPLCGGAAPMGWPPELVGEERSANLELAVLLVAPGERALSPSVLACLRDERTGVVDLSP
jgi:hypothetical protein